jgi:hypothetical protein
MRAEVNNDTSASSWQRTSPLLADYTYLGHLNKKEDESSVRVSNNDPIMIAQPACRYARQTYPIRGTGQTREAPKASADFKSERLLPPFKLFFRNRNDSEGKGRGRIPQDLWVTDGV